jgi:hypothetical protein
VQDLRDYGRGLSDIVLDPEVVRQGRRASRTVLVGLRRELGTVGVVKLALRVRRESGVAPRLYPARCYPGGTAVSLLLSSSAPSGGERGETIVG